MSIKEQVRVVEALTAALGQEMLSRCCVSFPLLRGLGKAAEALSHTNIFNGSVRDPRIEMANK